MVLLSTIIQISYKCLLEAYYCLFSVESKKERKKDEQLLVLTPFQKMFILSSLLYICKCAKQAPTLYASSITCV